MTQLLDLVSFFKCPSEPKQKQYEALRAIIVDNESVQSVAERFGYSVNTLYSLIRDAKVGKVELFPNFGRIKGPKQRHTSMDIQKQIVALRVKKQLSTQQISTILHKQQVTCSPKTVERILNSFGFPKLKRRTYKQLGKTVKSAIIPERTEHLDFDKLEPFSVDCPAVGVYFFLPYIMESKLITCVQQCDLPQSSDIGHTQAFLSMLLLKLIGKKRLSHLGDFNREPGLGPFAGLNILPKATYMSTYSCRCSEENVLELQQKVIGKFRRCYPNFYQSDFINLDFHSIPHYGKESEMEKVWCGAKGKSLKGANTVVAQDSQSQALIYTRSDILRSEESQEVKKFVAYWKQIKHRKINETLVFDCKFTTYPVLDELTTDNIYFLTLRKRPQSLIDETLALPKSIWKRVYVAIPKRKYTQVSVYESKVTLKGCRYAFRQIAIKDHGRAKPTFIITNHPKLSLDKILEVYAKRWRVENKLAEMITFFNLNALSSPLMIRIHFDMLFSMIADTFYHRFAYDLPRFENLLAPQISRKFIDMPGRVIYDGNNFCIKIRKRAHTPILLGLNKLNKPFRVPWLNNKKIKIVWTA